MTNKFTQICFVLYILALTSCEGKRTFYYTTLKDEGIIEEYEQSGKLIKKTKVSNCFYDKKVIIIGDHHLIKSIIFYTNGFYHGFDSDSFGKTKYSYGFLNDDVLIPNGYASFNGYEIDYLHSEFIHVVPNFIKTKDSIRCNLKIVYYTPGIPENMYIILKKGKFRDSIKYDTVRFSKLSPICGKYFSNEEISNFKKGFLGLSRIYPCYYSKEIELNNLNADTNYFSGAVNAFYSAGKQFDNDSTYYARRLNFKVVIYKKYY